MGDRLGSRLGIGIGAGGVCLRPYYEAGGERFYMTIVLTYVRLKRAEMFVGVAPGSGEIAIWLEEKQGDAVGFHCGDGCGDVLGPVIFVGNWRRDRSRGLQ